MRISDKQAEAIRHYKMGSENSPSEDERMLAADLLDARKERDEWKNAVLDASVVSWVYTTEHETNPRKAVKDLLDCAMCEALDPKISKPAAAMLEEIARLRREIKAGRILIDAWIDKPDVDDEIMEWEIARCANEDADGEDNA